MRRSYVEAVVTAVEAEEWAKWGKVVDAMPDDEAKREAWTLYLKARYLKARGCPQDHIDDYLSVKFGD